MDRWPLFQALHTYMAFPMVIPCHVQKLFQISQKSAERCFFIKIVFDNPDGATKILPTVPDGILCGMLIWIT